MTQLNNYRNAHFWLLIPLIFTILGFFRGYFMKLDQATWHQHMHGITAIVWYVIVIIQPYLITRKNARTHRFLGKIALFVAGGVTFSAITIIPRNLVAAATLEENPIVSVAFLYGVSLTDITSIIGFATSVLLGLKTVKNMEDHSIWMISSVFWALMPGFGRFAMNIIVLVFGFPPPYDFIHALMFSVPIILAPLIIIGIKFRRWHPALIAAGIGNMLYLFVGPIGRSELWRSIADSLLKY